MVFPRSGGSVCSSVRIPTDTDRFIHDDDRAPTRTVAVWGTDVAVDAGRLERVSECDVVALLWFAAVERPLLGSDLCDLDDVVGLVAARPLPGDLGTGRDLDRRGIEAGVVLARADPDERNAWDATKNGCGTTIEWGSSTATGTTRTTLNARRSPSEPTSPRSGREQCPLSRHVHRSWCRSSRYRSRQCRVTPLVVAAVALATRLPNSSLRDAPHGAELIPGPWRRLESNDTTVR